MGVNVIPRFREEIAGEIFVHGFDFLHEQDIGVARFEPINDLFAANFNGIDVPTGYFDWVRWQRTSRIRMKPWR